MPDPETWKEFETEVTHSVAHHLVAIASLLDEYGYARVSDVAERLAITRGSASITLKRLKQRGLVTEDDRRFLGLSEEGERIARLVQAKRYVMKKLLVDVLGVEDGQAECDTCKIEHLVSDRTAERVTGLLRFVESGAPEGRAFLKALARFAGRAREEDKTPARPEDSDAYRYYQESQGRE